MAKYLITGGNKLHGKIVISGNKNSIVPCLAAAILTKERIIIRNVPQIADVKVFVEILNVIGSEVKYNGDTIEVKCADISCHSLPQELMNKLRASILLIGPLLTRCGKVEFYHPGGDVIGRRNIDTHLRSLESLGYKFSSSDQSYKGWKVGDKTGYISIYLDEASVTATENIVLASVIGSGKVVIKNCAEEPHVVDLCQMLVLMGAKISGIGTSTLEIEGVKILHGTDFTIRSDYVEFGTYAIAAVITGGSVDILKENLPELDPVISVLSKMGIVFRDNHQYINVSAQNIKPIPKIVTNIWPGFPTDLMSVVIILATQAKGVSLCHDWMYESRMFFVDKLITMGASITIADPHRVIISGPSKLRGRVMETPDIRAGMALVLSALVATGDSVIEKIELVERGYEDVIGKLTTLGAQISRVI